MTIDVHNLSKRYRGRVIALDAIELSIPDGMYGLLGANGAGKTTLMRILAGIIRPTAGTVHINGHDLSTSHGRRAVQQTLGYLPQEIGFYPDLSARAFLDYIAILKGIDDTSTRRRRVNDALELVALADVGKRKLGGLSGGMKRRVGIAQALLADPSLLIVDEPTAGLDPEERIRFRNLLTTLAGERAVLLSTHIVEDVASSCRQLAILNHGRVLYAGDTDGVIDAAAGKTWQIRLPATTPPQDELTVVSALHHGDSISYRVVTNGSTPPHGTPLDPTLEDGYLAIMHDADQLRNLSAAG